jgi:uncharacterized membrane protein
MQQFIKQNKLIILILILAAFLRILDLGRSSFWYDEARVAIAAVQPTLFQAVKIARLDVAAPPLDYILVWLMGHISLSEAWLRLPEALWGVAAVGVVYAFARQLIGRFAALVAAACLALASVHIYFSQELRFYAPLFFFYWLLTWLLYRALTTSTRRNWLLVIEAAVIGAYFHFYTLLAFFNGLVFLAILAGRSPRGPQWKSAWQGFFISGSLTALFVLPGFLVFGLSRTMPELSLMWSQFFPELSKALGWSSLYGYPLGNILGACLLILSLSGLIIAIFRRNWVLVGLTASITLQVGLLVVMDILARYFFVMRSFLFALPLTLCLTGYALDTLARGKVESFKPFSTPPRRLSINLALAGLILTVLVGLSLAAFMENRPFVKSNARSITAYLHQVWQPGDQVWVNPFYETLVYRFYLEVYFSDERMSDLIGGYRWEDLPNPDEITGRVFLLTEQPTPELLQDLQAHRFTPIPDLEGPRWLWVHSD